MNDPDWPFGITACGQNAHAPATTNIEYVTCEGCRVAHQLRQRAERAESALAEAERQRDEWRNERHRLESDLFGILHSALNLPDDETVIDMTRRVVRQRDALREALKKFGRHTACASGHAWTWSEADLELCDCGLAAALKETAR